MEKDSFCRLDVDTILRLGEGVAFDIYIGLPNGQILKVSHSEDDFRETVKKYKSKGVQAVYVNKNQYVNYLTTLKNTMVNKFYDPATTTAQSVDLMNDAYNAVKESFTKIGVDETVIAVAEEISKKSLSELKKSASLFKFFMDFKDKCDKQFMKKMLISYTASTMIGTFEWQTNQIKEKTSLAAMLCDVLLEPEDFEILHKAYGNPLYLTDKIRNHPMDVSKLITQKDNLVAKETIIIIEQHHERPNGDGYPRKIGHALINLLSAIYIVADNYIELLVAKNFDFKYQSEILTEISNAYNAGNFRKATQSLYKIFGLEYR